MKCDKLVPIQVNIPKKSCHSHKPYILKNGKFQVLPHNSSGISLALALPQRFALGNQVSKSPPLPWSIRVSKKHGIPKI